MLDRPSLQRFQLALLLLFFFFFFFYMYVYKYQSTSTSRNGFSRVMANIPVHFWSFRSSAMGQFRVEALQSQCAIMLIPI